MKKILFILAALVFSFASANPQNWLVLKGGGGLTLLPGYAGVTPGLAIDGGVGYKQQISKRMVVEGDILMASRSYSVSTGMFDFNNEEIIFAGGANYVQVPMTLHYNIPFRKKELVPYYMGQPKSKFFVEGGPYFAYALTMSTYMDPNIALAYIGSDDEITEEDMTPRKIDAGITAGLGLNFGFDESLHRLTVGARANYGLLNIYKDSRMGSATNMSAVGYITWDISLTKRQHIKHRW